MWFFFYLDPSSHEPSNSCKIHILLNEIAIVIIRYTIMGCQGDAKNCGSTRYYSECICLYRKNTQGCSRLQPNHGRVTVSDNVCRTTQCGVEL